MAQLSNWFIASRLDALHARQSVSHLNSFTMNSCHARYIPYKTSKIRQTVPPISPVAIRMFVRISRNRLIATPAYRLFGGNLWKRKCLRSKQITYAGNPTTLVVLTSFFGGHGRIGISSSPLPQLLPCLAERSLQAVGSDLSFAM